MLICPICKNRLSRSTGAYICPQNHNFDISRRGYVNLLCSQSSKNHGDDKRMAIARRDFLNAGYYSRLRDSICSVITHGPALDICCGEGYYLEGITQKLAVCDPGSSACGIDISKSAIDAACRRKYNVETHLAVANCTDIPVQDGCFSFAVSVFAPVSEQETKRILRQNGCLIRVVPGRDHLIELKRAVYEHAQLNPAFNNTLSGFELKSAHNLIYNMHLNSADDIKNLFVMTPYYYRTTQKDQQKLRLVSQLDVTAHFYIFVYKAV